MIILPNSVRLVLTMLILPEIFVCLVALGCHIIQNSVCMGLSCFYILYHVSEITSVKVFSPNSISVFLVALVFLVTSV